MCDDMPHDEDIKFSLTVMMNEEENRVFYAVADSHFVDILLSFLTLPLARILKVLEKHYGDEAPTFGSLSTLYNGLADLDTSHFVTEAAKNTLLHPVSSFDDELVLIPLGKVEHLMGGNTGIKAVDNLYRSSTGDDSIIGKCNMRFWLKEPELPHGYISENHILPLTQEPLNCFYNSCYANFTSVKFPRGQGRYLTGSQTYQVKDDLTVTPYCSVSILSSLRRRKISLSDIKEVELNVGCSEGLSILTASLTSTTALTDALLNHKLNKQPKTEEV